MLRIILGVILMVGGVATFFIQDNPGFQTFKNDLLCQPGETYVEELGAYNSGSFQVNDREFIAYCLNDGVQRDITAQGFFFTAGMFVLPFVVGLVLFIWGVTAVARKRSRRVSIGSDPFGQPIYSSDDFGQPVVQTFNYDNQPGSSATVVTVNGQQVQSGDLSSLPPETAQLVQKMLGGLNLSMSQMSQFAGKTDLADRLRQLQEARDAGLITQEEFDRTRQQILDSLND